MGIIKAGMGAIRGAAADQWKEAFFAGEMGSETLMIRAQRMAGQHSENGGSSGVITDGSIIAVGEGECAIATEGGKIIGIYDQPGEHTFKSNRSKGVFGGGLGAFAKDVGQRIAFGGDVAITQRLYYINTKELTGGAIRAIGIPLRYKDEVTGLDTDGGISCYGSYTFRIADPELFFKAAIRSQVARYRTDLLKQMDTEVLTALAPALAQMTEKGIRPNELPQHAEVLCEKLRQVMNDKWSGLRGIEVFSVGLESVTVLDANMLRDLQQTAVLQDQAMAGAHIVGAAADAVRAAASNRAGASALVAAILGKPSAQQTRWKCKCGTENSGKFCVECGAAKTEEWVCSCGTTNQGKFCTDCGKKRL